QALSVDLAAVGLLADLPNLLAPPLLVGSGAAVDWLAQRRRLLSLTAARKLMNLLSMLCPAALLLVLAIAALPPLWAVALLVLASTSTAFSGGMSGNYVDLSPRYASFIFAYVNACGTIPGIAGTLLTGALLDAAQGSWRWVLLTGVAFYSAATIVYSVWGSAE